MCARLKPSSACTHDFVHVVLPVLAWPCPVRYSLQTDKHLCKYWESFIGSCRIPGKTQVCMCVGVEVSLARHLLWPISIGSKCLKSLIYLGIVSLYSFMEGMGYECYYCVNLWCSGAN